MTSLFATDQQVGVPDEAALARFADASLRSDRVDPITHLAALIEAIGDEAALATTATIASFQMANRVIESASLRLTPRMRQLADDLGVTT